MLCVKCIFYILTTNLNLIALGQIEYIQNRLFAVMAPYDHQVAICSLNTRKIWMWCKSSFISVIQHLLYIDSLCKVRYFKPLFVITLMIVAYSF